MVECYWPEMTAEHVEDALDRLARSGGGHADPDPVQHAARRTGLRPGGERRLSFGLRCRRVRG